MTSYSKPVEEQMRLFFSNLNEKEQRHYAYLESLKLVCGEKKYIANLLGISEACIRRGEAELTNEQLFCQTSTKKLRL
ncbi:MAG: hypothetical protein P1U70_26995 [Saprospiraceae bacterium]|jgi:hypothetical protein|nr:hypothetical protein [Saprospiraceae bacterium]